MKISVMARLLRRIEQDVDARHDHVAELAGVVGGARHDVAHALAVVEGLALAQQADVQLVARVALQALAQELVGEVAQPR